jgi:hypothetical protein
MVELAIVLALAAIVVIIVLTFTHANGPPAIPSATP